MKKLTVISYVYLMRLMNVNEVRYTEPPIKVVKLFASRIETP